MESVYLAGTIGACVMGVAFILRGPVSAWKTDAIDRSRLAHLEDRLDALQRGLAGQLDENATRVSELASVVQDRLDEITEKAKRIRTTQANAEAAERRLQAKRDAAVQPDQNGAIQQDLDDRAWLEGQAARATQTW